MPVEPPVDDPPDVVPELLVPVLLPELPYDIFSPMDLRNRRLYILVRHLRLLLEPLLMNLLRYS